ncbi:MAG: DUF3784 domain-containing protein [Tissierellia bacterium]|nr:DUF3784 domain-containing protein [Tissierellia bacterium]
MKIFAIILILTGIMFEVFGGLIYFKKNYELINGFKNSKKNIKYARRVGFIEIIVGISLILIGFIIK